MRYDPSDPAVIADPYPALLALQRDEPAHFSPRLKAWILTRHADVAAALSSNAMSVDRIRPFYAALPDTTRASLADIVRYLSLWLVFRDPPEHTRLRSLMATAFTMKAVADLRPGVEELVDQLLDQCEGEVDFVERFAMRLPGLVIMDLLGVPRERMDDVKGWSDAMQLFIGSAQNTPDKYDRASAGARSMAGLFRELIEDRREAPQDDLISAFIAARDAEDRLSEDELIAACMLVLFGGHETTTNLLTTGLLKFIRHREVRERLAAEPALAGKAMEECLRLDGPSGSMARLVAQDHDLHGQRLKAGDRVFAMINAANQDPYVFDRPTEFDIARPRNRHLTFGYGPHFCIGAALARLEGEVAFLKLAQRFPGMALNGALVWHETIIMRGLREMPVKLQ
ncbi:MAG: cytochrome P450 [Pseudomonadota bacterium]